MTKARTFVRLTPHQAYQKGLITRQQYTDATNQSLAGYCFCGKSNLWDERCPSCGKRPYTD